MKKSLLLLSLLLAAGAASAQDDKKENTQDKGDQMIEHETYNKWTIELNVGQSKGTRPYTPGYFSSNPDKVLGSVDFNYYNAGVRYMFSPKFGLKLDGSYDHLTNNEKTNSLPFDVEQVRVSIQAAINMARLLDVQEQLGRLSFIGHAGFEFAWVTPKLDTPLPEKAQYLIEGASNYGHTEHDLGVIIGISPEVRLIKRVSLIADFSYLYNFRQHFNWDGHYAQGAENLTGSMVMGSLGLTYSFGKENLHGDWAIVEDKRLDQVAELDKRVGDLESMMNDADKDGVPDYLDVENNSIPGVAVDTKGRMVDMNKNGIPDELEKYMANNYVDKASGAAMANVEMIKKLINEGYVTTYFDYNKTKPTNVSTEGIDFILTYLRNNPDATIDIIGNADETGRTEYNNKLANDRAASVKEILVKAGVNPSRLNVISRGEDNSVDKDSEGARKLVRRVIFKVK